MLYNEIMIKEKRLKFILTTLENYDIVKIIDLQVVTKIPIATLQRDLKELEQANLVSRRHGSVMLKKLQENFFENIGLNMSKKTKIAKIAASYVEQGSVIFIDAGSTSLNIIDYISKSITNLTIVTNSISLIEKVDKCPYNIHVIGGELKKSTKAIIGVQAINCVDKYNFDIAFIGVNGKFGDSYYTPSIEEAELKSKVISSSDKVIFLFDSSKLNKKFTYKFANEVMGKEIVQ